jgi:hypothetical protein
MLERHREIIEDMLQHIEDPSLLTLEEMDGALSMLREILSQVIETEKEATTESNAEAAISALRNICSDLYRNGYMQGRDKLKTSHELDAIQDRIVRATL